MTPHHIQTDSIRDRCIQLYSLLRAGCPSEGEDDPLVATFVELYRFNISNLMLEIATRARVLDDILLTDGGEYAMPKKRKYKYSIPAVEEGRKSELGLREISNKIIHAQLIELIGKTLDSDWQEALDICRDHSGELRLLGTKGEKKWTVRLEPISYCREILEWLNEADEMGRLHKLYQ